MTLPPMRGSGKFSEVLSVRLLLGGKPGAHVIRPVISFPAHMPTVFCTVIGVSNESPDSILVFLGLVYLRWAALPRADMP